jgi:hypothetical protein
LADHLDLVDTYQQFELLEKFLVDVYRLSQQNLSLYRDVRNQKYYQAISTEYQKRNNSNNRLSSKSEGEL